MKSSENTLQIQSIYRDSSRDRHSIALAGAAAGTTAGLKAAELGVTPSNNIYTETPSIKSQSNFRTPTPAADSALSRLKSPSPPLGQTRDWSSKDTVVTSARDELSKRLTPLTRLATPSVTGSRPYRRTTTSTLDTSDEQKSTSKPAVYRRTTTTGIYDSLPSQQDNNSSTLPRPAYRRTNTMDLPSVSAEVSRPSDFRRLLQPVNRRYSTAR